MSSEEKLRKKLERMQRWVDRCAALWQKTLSASEAEYVQLVRELEEAKVTKDAELKAQEEDLKSRIDFTGKEFTKTKYILERDTTKTKADIEKAKDLIDGERMQLTAELQRIKQEQANSQIAFERQKSALMDLYQEKTRHLLVTREKLIRESAQANANLKTYKDKYVRELETIKSDGGRRVKILEEQLNAKREGWETAIQTLKREFDGLVQQKEDVEKKLNTIQAEKEKELEAARMQMALAREQLEMDKATLIEKAEEEQRQCEADVSSLQMQIQQAEKELQSFLLEHEAERKNVEEAFQNEESLLKEAVKNESEKRDYEQKLFAQEKADKERELARLKEEYDKKKWHWDNQVRTLLMQKSVQDAEHDADRLRVDREAREVLRSLQAKRDELKRRASDLKAKHDALVANNNKESDLMNQRWRWRKERIWSMWQNRLDVLKKERALISEQLQHLEDEYVKQKSNATKEERQQEAKIEDLRQYSLHVGERLSSDRKQRDVQIELEKTRLLAQIKECELLVSDWMDRQKLTQDEAAKRSSGFVQQMDFLDQLFKSEQHETELFLHSFRKALSVLQGQMERLGIKDAA